MRIGIFGGTFDPVHYGHLILAEQAREQAALDQVWFVPSARPPHKTDRSITPFDRRAAMLSLALAGQEGHFRVEPIESERPGLSYTADTLDALAERHPGNEWFLIVGADALRDLPGWHAPRRIVEAATLLLARRPGADAGGKAELVSALGMEPSKVRLHELDMPLIDISGRDLRQRAASGRSLLYQLPRAVEVFIKEKKLYAADR